MPQSDDKLPWDFTVTPTAGPSTTDIFKTMRQQTQQNSKTPRDIDIMRPKLNWIDPDATPKQQPSSILAPWWPQASSVTDWLSGPPGRPQAMDDPAYVRRLEGTLPLQGVRLATPEESRQQLLNNAPWLAKLLGN